MKGRFVVTYNVRSTPADIQARAQAIAVEQSVEMPLAAIKDSAILSDIVGKVEHIDAMGDGVFTVRIGLATETVGEDAGQVLNIIFGNTSLHEDVVLKDMIVPDGLIKTFGGPQHDIVDLRRRLGVQLAGVNRLRAKATRDVAEGVGIVSRAPRTRGVGFYQR